MGRKGRDTRDGDQGSSGVGGDDRDRQGQRIQDTESPRARPEKRSGLEGQADQQESRRTGSTPRPDKSGRGSTTDTGTRRGRGEKRTGETTRSGSRSNES
jgi:hypothetical protein